MKWTKIAGAFRLRTVLLALLGLGLPGLLLAACRWPDRPRATAPEPGDAVARVATVRVQRQALEHTVEQPG